MVIEIASFVLLAIGLGVFSWLKVPAWKEKSFGQRKFKWKVIIISSSVFSLICSVGIYLVTYNLWVSLSVGLVGYITILASVTDFGILKIPSEINGLGMVLFIPFVAIFWPSLDTFSLIFWFVLVFIFAVMSYFHYIGWADIELMTIFGFTFSWWVGMENMAYGLIGAVFVQLILIPLAGPLKLGIKKKIGERTQWNEETKRVEIIVEEPSEDDFIGGHLKRSIRTKNRRHSKKKPRTHLPFGPALLIAYMGVAIYSAFHYVPFVYPWWAIQ